LFGPHRMNGTLLAYRRHSAGENWFDAPGEQDLTAHVNFEWCAAVAAEAGFVDIAVQSQKTFLVEQGILTKLTNHDGADPFSPEARANRAIRQLLLSDGMSELFKVMTMTKA
ncbi:MAG TPA: SAM-dependent methyltransferase, partial [Paenibacillus sp.]|nr:SAM-dependent methyltransferase [Paenibacillus sp.]